jgi:hypothetical protein
MRYILRLFSVNVDGNEPFLCCTSNTIYFSTIFANRIEKNYKISL